MTGIEKITEQETAHPSLQQLSQLTGSSAVSSCTMENVTVSHEIEERAPPLIEEDDENDDSESMEKDAVDKSAFQGEPSRPNISSTTSVAVNILTYHS